MKHIQQNTQKTTAEINGTSSYRLRNRTIPISQNNNTNHTNSNPTLPVSTQSHTFAQNGCQRAAAQLKVVMDIMNPKPKQALKGLTVQLPECPKTPQVYTPFPLTSPSSSLIFSPIHFPATKLSSATLFSPLDEVKPYQSHSAKNL